MTDHIKERLKIALRDHPILSVEAIERIEGLEATIEDLRDDVAHMRHTIEAGTEHIRAAERERICQYIKSREMWARLRDKNIGEIPHTIAAAIREETDADTK